MQDEITQALVSALRSVVIVAARFNEDASLRIAREALAKYEQMEELCSKKP